MWFVLHKVVVVSEWRGWISDEVDKSCPHCGPLSVESMEHKYYNCLLAQLVWRYVANIVWWLHVKRTNAWPRKFFSMLWCLLDKDLPDPLKKYHRIWLFLCSGLTWIIWKQWNDMIFNSIDWPIEKTWQHVWDARLDYGRIERQRTLKALEKAHDVAFKYFDKMWCVKVLIATRSNLVVYWKITPK